MGGNGAKSATGKNAKDFAKRVAVYKDAKKKLSSANGALTRTKSRYLRKKAMTRALDKHLQKVGNKSYEKTYTELRSARKSYAKAIKTQKAAQRRYNASIPNK